jgi:hypothetical protein
MSYQKNKNQKINSGSSSVSESVALRKGLSFPAVPALQRQGAEEELQMKKIPAQLMEEEEPLQGKFETVQKIEEEEPLQGKFETIQKVEEEEPLQGKFETVQKVEEEEPLQGKFETIQKVEEEEPLQGKFETIQKVEEEEPLQGKFETIQKVEPPKNTSKQNGLPGNLKSGIEQLSGYSMDDVKVHYNSSQPAQLQAHAYAQGTDIHIAPGQEKHLPHEAWHVAQQKQGRVKPTLQMKTGVPVNDDAGLENEADVMGAKAVQLSKMPLPHAVRNKQSEIGIITQLVEEKRRPLGGINGYFQRALGLKPPKEEVSEKNLEKGTVGENEKKQAAQIPSSAPTEQINVGKKTLSQIQSEIQILEQNFEIFIPLHSEYKKRIDQFDSIKNNKPTWEKFALDKGKVNSLIDSLSKEQKKVPPGRKHLIENSQNQEISNLLNKDFTNLVSEKYQKIKDIQVILADVTNSSYLKNARYFNSELSKINQVKQKNKESIPKENSTDFAKLDNAKAHKLRYETLIKNLENYKSEIQKVEEKFIPLLDELDQKSRDISNSQPSSLENLQDDFKKLQKFVIDDYVNWKKEQEEIDALIAKKKKWIGKGLTEEEIKQLDQYLANNSYLSAEPVQKNIIEVKDILKSLSKPTADFENLQSLSGNKENGNGNLATINKNSVQGESGSAETEKIYSPEEIKKSKSQMSWKAWLSEKTKEEKHNDIILKEKKLRSEYQRVGYVEKDDLKPGKSFIEKSPTILASLDWDGLTKFSEYDKLIGEDDKSNMDKASADANFVQGQTKQSTALAINGLKISGGHSGMNQNDSQESNGKIIPKNDSETALSQITNQKDNKEIEGILKETQTVFSDALTGILGSIDGMMKLKAMVSGDAEVNGQNVAKVAGGIAKLANAGLKITSTINNYSVTSTVMSSIPILGLAISTIKAAEHYFSNSIAETSELTMKIYAEQSRPPNFDNELVFESKEKVVLGSTKVIKHIRPAFYKAAKEAFNEYSNSRGNVSSSSQLIAALNNKFSLKKKVAAEVNEGEGELDLEKYLSELETYSLMARLEEINFTKKIHSQFDLVKEGFNLSAQISSLIPGGQIVAGALTVASGTMGVGKSLGMIVNKYMTGDDNGMFGIGRYGEDKHAKYVMHAKKIIEMYSNNVEDLITQQRDVEKANEKDENIKQNLNILEKVVYAAGAYPPDLYKSAEGDKKGYKAVGKLVSGMKQR